MTLQRYKQVQAAVAFILAIVFSQAVILKNFVIPIIFLFAACAVLLTARRCVKEIIEDERDRAVGGDAAQLAIKIYGLAAVVISIAFYVLRDNNPAYVAIAATLSYSTLLLIFLYTIIFKYHSRFKLIGRKNLYLSLAVLIIAIITVFGLRLFSGEDAWLCQNGQWIQHGHPSFPAPTTVCK